MSDISVKEAKKTYIETGRLNRNIIDKEVSISWYKCKLQSMLPKDKFKINSEDIKNPFDTKFLNYIDSIINEHYQYVVANKSLQVCAKRINDENIKNLMSIDDLNIGTNGGYIAHKIHMSHQVLYEEHYLEILSPYCTVGIVLTDQVKTFGTLMIISELKLDEYEVIRISELLSKYYNKVEFDVIEENREEINEINLSLSEVLAYPVSYLDDFNLKLNKIQNMGIPIVIKGDTGTGKTTLATYFLLKSSQQHTIVALTNSNKFIQVHLLNDALFHNDTVVIEDLEFISENALQLLTVYTEGILTKLKQNKYSDYKCSKLILTTVNSCESSDDIGTYNRSLVKLLDKLTMSTVNLVNSSEFKDELDEIISTLSKRYPFKMSSSFQKQVRFDLLTQNYKVAVENIEISMNNHINIESKVLIFHVNDIKYLPKTLEEMEYEHIRNVYEMMDLNIAATADVLEIGRTTLYRKLEKMKLYQNETKK